MNNDKNKTVECKIYLNTTTKLHLIDSIKKYLNKKNVEYIINEKGDSIYFSTGVNGINYKKMDFLYKYKMYDDKKKKYIHDEANRGHLLKNAAHLVKNEKFIIPAYNWWTKPYYTIGLTLYDLQKELQQRLIQHLFCF